MNITTELISNVSSSRGGVVKVTWDPPTIPEEYSSVVRVLSYVVTVVFSDASEEVLQEVTVAANVTWAVIPQLGWGRRYAFIIRVNFSSFSNLGPPALGRVALPQGTVTGADMTHLAYMPLVEVASHHSNTRSMYI